MAPHSPSPRALLAVGIFLCFAAAACFYAGITLLLPSTVLDRAWALNPKGHQQLASLGRTLGIPFLFLSMVFFLDVVGWFRRRLWAWKLTVLLIATQVVGDLVNVWRGEIISGGFGFVIASALLFYLFRPSIRSAFAK